jgi:hypothetical protein
MKKNTLIKHKEAIVICEESELVCLNYNALITTLEANTMVKHVVPIVIAKSTLTCTNCGKIRHLVDTCYNRKREIPIVPTATIKSIKLVVGTKTQPIKSGKIRVHYPYIICFSVKHRSRECPRKIEAHNMFKTKPISSNVMKTPKLPKIDNVPINVVVVITTHN